MSQCKVFLCHNSKDKPEIRQIKDKLLQQGIETWMDEKDIIGFDDWKKKIKENLSQMNAVAVFLGSSGFGEWQRSEIIWTEEEKSRRQNKKLFPFKQETTLRVGLVILPSCQQTFQKIQNQYYHTPYGWLFNYHTVDLRASAAPMKELIGAITGQPWQVDGSSREVIETQYTPQNQRDDSGDDLRTEWGVDYTRLRDLLKAQKWKEADTETLFVMLKATGREKEGWFSTESIENFPCTDLRMIDELWVNYSEGRFGLSVQKRIWESVGKDDGIVMGLFMDRVGWEIESREMVETREIHYAPLGQFPMSPFFCIIFGENWVEDWNDNVREGKQEDSGFLMNALNAVLQTPLTKFKWYIRNSTAALKNFDKRGGNVGLFFSRVQTCKL